MEFGSHRYDCRRWAPPADAAFELEQRERFPVCSIPAAETACAFAARLGVLRTTDQKPGESCDSLAPVRVDGVQRLGDVDLTCAELTLELGDGAELELVGARLNGARLRVTSAGQALLRMRDTSAERLALELAGGAYAEIVDSVLTSPSVQSAEDVQGRALRLDNSNVSGLIAIGGPRFEIAAMAGELRDSRIAAGRIVLEAGLAGEVEIRADELYVLGGALIEGRVTVGRALIMDALVAGGVFVDCGDLHIANADVSRARIGGANSGPLRADASSLSDVVVFADIDATNTSCSGAVLGGPGHAVDLVDSEVEDSDLCGAAALEGTRDKITCVACTLGAPEFVCLHQSAVSAPTCPEIAQNACGEPPA